MYDTNNLQPKKQVVNMNDDCARKSKPIFSKKFLI